MTTRMYMLAPDVRRALGAVSRLGIMVHSNEPLDNTGNQVPLQTLNKDSVIQRSTPIQTTTLSF